MSVRLDPLAEADLDRVSRPDFARVRQALTVLGSGAAGLEVAPLEGHAPWQVLVVEGHWIVFRTLPQGDQYVARIVTRRELARIVEELG
jgi:hypothetical protein